MPRGPATPTGQPMVFERTIAFTPFASDGRSAREPTPARPVETPDPQALEDGLRQLPQDSIEAELARDRRQMDRWGWTDRMPGR